MPEIDDSGNRQRWIIRLLLVLAVIVGVVAYRHDASSETESTAGSGDRDIEVHNSDGGAAASIGANSAR